MEIFAGYVRVSTDDQIEYSPESQIKLLRESAKKDGGIIPDEFMFSDEGISGKDAAHRPEFNRMISLAKEKDPPFSRIYVWKYSRFARNQEESIVYKNMLRKNNIDVVSISEPIIDGAFGSLIERIIEWQDEYYLINLSTEVKRGMLEKASRGEAMCRTYGYDYVDKKTYVPNADADVVRDVFDSFVKGESMRNIATRLAADGVKNSRGNPPDGRWVNYMLHNPVYIGKIRWSKEGRAASKRHYDSENIVIADGKHEPIISMDVWNKAQEILKRYKEIFNKNERTLVTRHWPLRGVAKCECGANLTYNSKKYDYVQCTSYIHGKGCRTSHLITVDNLTKALVKSLIKTVSSNNVNIKPQKRVLQVEDSSKLKKLITAEERKLKRCTEAYQAGYDTLEEYGKNKKEITERINELREKLKPAPIKEMTREEFNNKLIHLINILQDETVTNEEKNIAVRKLIDSVTYHKKSESLTVLFK